MMRRAEVMQVIRTNLLVRGDGKGDPLRVITQYWSLDGELLAEIDPTPGSKQEAERSGLGDSAQPRKDKP